MPYKPGHTYTFFFLHYDIEDSRGLLRSQEGAAAVKLLSAFFTSIVTHFKCVKHRVVGGDSGLAAFGSEEPLSSEVVLSAASCLQSTFEALKKENPVLGSRGLRIWCFQSGAVYQKKLDEFLSAELGDTIVRERQFAKSHAITLDTEMHQRLLSDTQLDFETFPAADGKVVYRKKKDTRDFCKYAKDWVLHERSRPLTQVMEEGAVHHRFVIRTKDFNAAKQAIEKLIQKWIKADISEYVVFALLGAAELLIVLKAKPNSTIQFEKEVRLATSGKLKKEGIIQISGGETWLGHQFTNELPVNASEDLRERLLLGKAVKSVIWMEVNGDLTSIMKESILDLGKDYGDFITSLHIGAKDAQGHVNCLISLVLPCGYLGKLRGLSKSLEDFVSGKNPGRKETYQVYEVIASS